MGLYQEYCEEFEANGMTQFEEHYQYNDDYHSELWAAEKEAMSHEGEHYHEDNAREEVAALQVRIDAIFGERRAWKRDMILLRGLLAERDEIIQRVDPGYRGV